MKEIHILFRIRLTYCFFFVFGLVWSSTWLSQQHNRYNSTVNFAVVDDDNDNDCGCNIYHYYRSHTHNNNNKHCIYSLFTVYSWEEKTRKNIQTFIQDPHHMITIFHTTTIFTVDNSAFLTLTHSKKTTTTTMVIL